jgi:hypothetical protein
VSVRNLSYRYHPLFTVVLLCVLLWPAATGVMPRRVMAQQDQPTDSAPAQTSQGEASAVTSESVQLRRVKVNFYINSIQNIEDEAGTYVIDFWLDLFWRDPALAGKTVDEVDPVLLWNPRIEALNSSDLTVIYQSYVDSFEPDSNVYLSQRLVGTFTNVFELERFPFDRQWLVITLESAIFDSNRVLFDFLGADQEIIYSEKPFIFPVPLGKYISTEFSLSEWSLLQANVIQQIHVLPYDKSSWAQFRIELELERQSQAYVLKIMLVFALIMLLGVTVFAIALSELRYRLLALFLLLLAAITFDFTRLQNSPLVSYLTLLDIQVLLCYFVLGLAIAAVVLTTLQHKRGQTNLAERLNQGAAIGYGVLVLLINLGLGWYGLGG